jgi:hypothetical protein
MDNMRSAVTSLMEFSRKVSETAKTFQTFPGYSLTSSVLSHALPAHQNSVKSANGSDLQILPQDEQKTRLADRSMRKRLLGFIRSSDPCPAALHGLPGDHWRDFREGRVIDLGPMAL